MCYQGKYYKNDAWVKWTSQCKANYEYLVNYAILLCDEYVERFSIETRKDIFTLCVSLKVHKLEEVIRWCNNNIPELPELELQPMPVVMPKKYRLPIIGDPLTYGIYDYHIDNKCMDTIVSYRNYYNAKIQKGVLSNPRKEFKWTKRQPPQFLTIYHERINYNDQYNKRAS